jgi:hypothetical protein
MARKVWVSTVSGPLAPYAAGFASWMASRAYSPWAAADRLYQFDHPRRRLPPRASRGVPVLAIVQDLPVLAATARRARGWSSRNRSGAGWGASRAGPGRAGLVRAGPWSSSSAAVHCWGVSPGHCSRCVVHDADRAAEGFAEFAASLLLATRGHPVRLADASFFLDELGVEPPPALLAPQDAHRVQRRFIVYVLLLMILVFGFLEGTTLCECSYRPGARPMPST